MLNPSFSVTKDQIEEFQKKGFLLLKKFYSPEFIDYIKGTIGKQIDAPTDKYQSGFSRLAFDMYDGDTSIQKLMESNSFRSIMSQLTGRNMFFAQALAFELERMKNKGFPWHIGTQSFGYHQANDYGCTIWAPLVHVNPSTQRGGMAYVPKDKVSGDFMYTHVDPAIFRALSEKIETNTPVTVDEFVEMRDGPLNDPAIKSILDHFAVEDEFQPGDALIFDKNVIHRSVMLGDGPIESRAAFVMRFFCETSSYDRRRAHDLEIPRKHFSYSGPTKFHLEVANDDGDKLIDSPLFKDQTYRHLRTPSPELA